MNVTAIKTHKITKVDTDIFAILDKYILNVSEKSVIAITSKIISITEGRIVILGSSATPESIRQTQEKSDSGQAKMTGNDDLVKDKLIQQEAEWYLPSRENKHGVSLAIANGVIAASAGIDESNGNGYYILWPQDPQKSANEIRAYLKKRFSLIDVGVVITDSKTSPLRWGVTGFALAYSGFFPLKDYIGTPDLFGKKLAYTKMNIADGLATSATVVMGEGNEQTPLALISDMNGIEFQDRNPTEEELSSLKINMDEDLYAPLLKSVSWKKGKK